MSTGSQRVQSPALDVKITYPADGATGIPNTFSPSGTRFPGNVAVTLTMAGQTDQVVPTGRVGDTNWTDPGSYTLANDTYSLTASVTLDGDTVTNTVQFTVG